VEARQRVPPENPRRPATVEMANNRCDPLASERICLAWGFICLVRAEGAVELSRWRKPPGHASKWKPPWQGRRNKPTRRARAFFRRPCRGWWQWWIDDRRLAPPANLRCASGTSTIKPYSVSYA